MSSAVRQMSGNVDRRGPAAVEVSSVDASPSIAPGGERFSLKPKRAERWGKRKVCEEVGVMV